MTAGRRGRSGAARAALAALAALLVGAAAATAQQPAAPVAGDELQVFLMTMGPGAALYERFGHNAIWIRNTATHRDLIYNYGEFDFSQPGFYRNFALGVPQYWLDVENLENTLAEYQQRQRSVSVQELRLTPAQRVEIANDLAVNVEPAHRIYTYNYYSANCSTRVRDLLDAVLGGALRRATQGRPAEGTLRFHTLRSIANNKLLYVGIDAGLGPRVDEPLDQWGEMFLPAKLEQRVRELRVPGPDGNTLPLVIGEAKLLDPNVYHVLAGPPHWGWALALIGLLAGAVMVSGGLAGGRGVPGRVLATVWLLAAGLGGLLLLFLWLFTRHVTSAWNHNLLFFDPLALLLLRGCWRRSGPTGRAVAAAAAILAILGALVALFPAIGVQRNWDMAELFAPMTIAAAWLSAGGWSRSPGAMPAGAMPPAGTGDVAGLA